MLSRGTWLNLAIALAASASLVAVWSTRDVAHVEEASLQILLPAFNRDDTTRLEFTSAKQTWVIERSASDAGTASFKLVQPVKEEADPSAVERYLSSLANAKAVRPVAADEPFTKLGLDHPGSQTIVTSAGRSYRIAIGGPAPTPEGARYVALSEGSATPRVVVIARSLLDELSVELDTFRKRPLATLNESDVTQIRITSAKLSLSLRRSTGINFLVEGETARLADRELLKSLFFQLNRLNASRFLSASEATSALGPAAASIELQSRAAEKPLRLELGGSCPGNDSELVVIRRAPDPAYACAPRDVEATLRLERSDFVDHHAFSLHTDEVEELEISGESRKFTLLRKGSGFLLRTNLETTVDLDAGNQRISEVLEARGELLEQANLAALDLDHAKTSITLRSSAAREGDVLRQVVRVGKTDAGGDLFLYREQDGAVLRIPHEEARAFAIDSTLLYSKKLTEFGLSSFAWAEIGRGDTREVLRRGADQELRLESPKGFDPDGVLSADLIQTLGALNAERFVADRDDGSFGLAHARISVRFAFKDGAGKLVEHQLRFGEETALGVFATLADNGPVFVLPRAVRETCDTLLINRAQFPSNADALSSLVLEAGPRKLRLERNGDHLSPVPQSAFPADRVSELLEAFGNLRPEAAIHTGPALSAEGFANPTLTLRLSSKLGVAQTLQFGAGDSWRQTNVFYLRVSGVEATFVIAQSKVLALRDAL